MHKYDLCRDLYIIFLGYGVWQQGELLFISLSVGFFQVLVLLKNIKFL